MRYLKWECANGHRAITTLAAKDRAPIIIKSIFEDLCGECKNEGKPGVEVVVEMFTPPRYRDPGQPGHPEWVDPDDSEGKWRRSGGYLRTI